MLPSSFASLWMTKLMQLIFYTLLMGASAIAQSSRFMRLVLSFKFIQCLGKSRNFRTKCSGFFCIKQETAIFSLPMQNTTRSYK